MSRTTRSEKPWHRAWRSSPLAYTPHVFWWLPAGVTGGQPLVCMRSLLAALGLSWAKWVGAVRVIARIIAKGSGASIQLGLSPHAEQTVLMPASLVAALLNDLSIVLAVNYPAGSTKLMMTAGGWNACWDDAQAAWRARTLAGAIAPENGRGKAEEKAAAASNDLQATQAAPATPGAVLRSLRGRYFMRSADMPALRDAARRMRRTGCSWKQIGRQLGVSASTARRLVVRERRPA